MEKETGVTELSPCVRVYFSWAHSVFQLIAVVFAVVGEDFVPNSVLECEILSITFIWETFQV